ncbi:hypothetical protein CMU30_03805 [Elizabethkingia anophelis]|nr:hypothetical protein [Elizabethkingia anophelis]MDV3675816.1 hypothetical protein [Elizabethkingia anophelis]MDV3683919.1 hypothetical protein [Elizabethkingia anophelis]MDV3699556.1 hypothetical protein [Elizabethkingia anophelis]MDV3761943.1 hypothetical protein [Elizabethkingia anophelis]
MDKELASYIITYFSDLMTDLEKLALRHHIHIGKTSDNSIMHKMLIEKGWIQTNPDVLDLLKNGYEEFEMNVASRIMAETPEKVFLNSCPKCNKLARTPHAKQCRYCGYNWHGL